MAAQPAVNSDIPALSPAPKLAIQTKFSSCWQAILSGKQLATSEQDLDRFFFDLFCLNVDSSVIAAGLHQVPEARVLGALQSNLGSFFRAAVRVLHEGSAVGTKDRDDLRREHAVQSLIPFMSAILAKKYSNYSFDVISLLAGSLEQSHAVFTDFVASLDTMLRDSLLPIRTRQTVLNLCLSTTCHAGQASLVAYFLRRDFFAAVNKLITDSPTRVPQALALIGVLANYHKENRNFYIIRLEDLVDEEFIKLAMMTLVKSMMECRERYIEIEDDSPPSFAATLTSFISSFRLSEFISPSRPSSPLPSPEKGKTPATGTLESAFANMPPPAIVLLFLPFYDLLYVNKAFSAQLFDPAFQELPQTLISLSSYTFCHASLSARARRYARLNLILLTLLVEDSSAALCGLESVVRICRQRQPMVPFSVGERKLMGGLLDSVLVFLRHNMSRKLDVGSYVLALRLVHKVLHHLKNEQTRLEHDWVGTWRAILSLAAFVVSRWDEMRLDPQIDQLVQTILVTLDYACVWAEAIFATEEASALLFYEILRAGNTLDKLSSLTAQPGTPTASKRKSAPSPLPMNQSVDNLKTVSTFFQRHVDEVRGVNGGEDRLDSTEMLLLIKRTAEQLQLVDSVSLENIRPFSESDHENFLRTLLRDGQQDVLEMAGLLQ